MTRKVGKVAEATIGRLPFPLGESSGSRALGHCLHVDPYPFALSSPHNSPPSGEVTVSVVIESRVERARTSDILRADREDSTVKRLEKLEARS